MEISFQRIQAATETRTGSVDLLRFLGAVGIIQFHCAITGVWFGLAALPMFIMLLVYLGAGRPLKAPFDRLLIPWLAWSGIYAALKVAQSLLTCSAIMDEFAPWMILTGTSIHLWFLFLLLFSFLFLTVCSTLRTRLPAPALWTVCITLWSGRRGFSMQWHCQFPSPMVIGNGGRLHRITHAADARQDHATDRACRWRFCGALGWPERHDVAVDDRRSRCCSRTCASDASIETVRLPVVRFFRDVSRASSHDRGSALRDSGQRRTLLPNHRHQFDGGGGTAS